MIMSNVKKQEQLKPVQLTETAPNVIDINLGQGDLRTIILDRILPVGADKWVNCLTNEELVPCYNSAFSVLEGSPFNQGQCCKSKTQTSRLRDFQTCKIRDKMWQLQ